MDARRKQQMLLFEGAASAHEADVAETPPAQPPDAPVGEPALAERCTGLLFCSRCGAASTRATEFCERCGTRRCVSCGEV